MGQYSPALLRRALHRLWALLAPARGRHATAARRRRSTRVRRYAPLPAPEPTSTPLACPTRPSPAPRLAAPSEHVSADEIALVRPYYSTWERERALDRVQARATARLNAWSGDLLAAPPSGTPLGEFDELAALVRTWQAQQTREVVAA
ncbi:hypothetical protein ACIBFB_12355 [Nocardiopsis sp. NPDC050513]|uniref:hypothetical protein n=1 Tax=Nocardiopsis sp. NPDC050513 TaxID=3364338 RepID=UPI0037A91E8D